LPYSLQQEFRMRLRAVANDYPHGVGNSNQSVSLF
jgi:hypothetical protein